MKKRKEKNKNDTWTTEGLLINLGVGEALLSINFFSTFGLEVDSLLLLELLLIWILGAGLVNWLWEG